MPKTKRRIKTDSPSRSSSRSTVSGPARKGGGKFADAAVAKMDATEALAAAMPYNRNKENEHGDLASEPQPGQTVEPKDPSAIASTLSERNVSAKTRQLDPKRADGAGEVLRTNQGVALADNQNSLKAGLRGPTLMEDFILREKITHFDHERIPERIVHARGSGAHGYFETYKSLKRHTKASLFAEAGKRTPVFVRFSTVVGERGSTDTARDVRGFAVKFYTDEGNWDLVGNNIPVFFIQDAMKFPDLVHAVKPEPHHAMPQAASAHDTFWDFAGLMPEIAHMLMWVMSDRAIPRSYRMMQGFGVHTFRLVNAQNESSFVKFHWSPLAGTHSLDWDEAVKISGADPDFHRRDLWEAIESGNYPEYELGMQIFSEAQAEKFSFDVLDPTKIVPEELVKVMPVGRMVLNRNPDNFFAETEQVAFCAAHIVPGLDFSNDPLLAGRIHSYIDTQISRLGGPNFHEIPVNAPLVQPHNNQRDGMHRQAIHRGRVAYEPNSLGGGCPFQAGKAGFTSFPDPTPQDKVRGKPEKFADHYSQATLFWNSQSEVEKRHIIRAFRFELTKVQTAAVRERMVSMLANVADELAQGVAEGLGIEVPEPMPLALNKRFKSEVEKSKALSLFVRPGETGIRTRRIAILVAGGVDGEAAAALHEGLLKAGAVPRFVGPRRGEVETEQGESLEVEVSLEAAPSVLYDAVAVPGGHGAVETLATLGHAQEFIKDAYRHCKPLLAIGAGATLLDACGAAEQTLAGKPDPGVLSFEEGQATEALRAFAAAIAKHRHFERELDPPPV
jgi:catalase